MNIHIIGAGAIGLLFAARLKQANHTVTLWCRTSMQANHIMNQGIRFEERASSVHQTTVFVDTVTVFNEIEINRYYDTPIDFTIVAVKQGAIEPVFLTHLQLYAKCVGMGTFIFIQNGIGHIEKVSSYIDDQHLIKAVTSEAALCIEEGVAHTGYGMTYLEGHLKSEQSTKIVEECLINAGIKASVSNDIEQHIYNKLVVNAVINPLTALYKVKNGQLPLHVERLKLMNLLFEETKKIIELSSKSPLKITFQDVLTVCEKTSSNQSSMLSDVLHGKMTEIEAINGAIVKLAEQHHVQAPINQTVYLLLAQHP